MTPKEYKLIFTGTMGAGKTTAIEAISQLPPVSTDVSRSDGADDEKTTTTAALDYGEVRLQDGDVLRLYGTPGQGRFEFMWDILAEGALGVIVLIDNRRPDPVGDLRGYLEAFRGTVGESRAVVGVGRRETHPDPDLPAFCEALAQAGFLAPVFSVNVTRREDVLMMVDVLFHQIEAASFGELNDPSLELTA